MLERLRDFLRGWLNISPARPVMEPTQPGLSLTEAVEQYQASLAQLTPETQSLLAVLLARSEVEIARRQVAAPTAVQVQQLVALDEQLRQVSSDRLESLPAWRHTLSPPEAAWWWYLDKEAQARQQEIEQREQENDLIWILLTGTLLLFTSTLTLEIIKRLWADAPDMSAILGTLLTLYPRNTLLLDDKPTLYWNDTGASSYTVILTHQRQPIWAQENVVGNSLTYPAGESPLETGKDYRFEVIDNDSQISSRQDESAGTGFRLATEEEQAEIEVGLAKITSVSELIGPDRDFAPAVYYAGLGTSPESGFSPLGEAWLLLKALAKTHEAPMIQLWYGDVLNRLILPNESAKAYQQALERAQQLGDLETQAAASKRLWCLTDEKNYYNEAVRLCEELSDQAQVEMLRQGDREVICK